MKSYWIVTRNEKAVIEPREAPIPEPKAGEIVMRVHAAGLNRGELVVGGAVHGGAEKLGGTEGSGVVHAIGEGVTGWKVGDRVFGRARGTWAEYGVIHTGQAMPMPQHLSWDEAAAIPSSFLTSYEALVHCGGLKRGETALIAGASSGVGVGCVQIAKVIGARSIGTSTSPAKLGSLKAIGLDVGIDSTEADFSQRVLDATEGKGADIAVNLVGGSVFPQLLRSLAYEGRMAIVGYVDLKYLSEIDLGLLHLNRLHVFGISNAKQKPEKRHEVTRGFRRDILPAIAADEVRPVVDRVFALDDLPRAKDYMESNAQVGKVIVKVP
jgi:NADPH:quinone reductase-like Zn-dependent oxidoreductase